MNTEVPLEREMPSPPARRRWPNKLLALCLVLATAAGGLLTLRLRAATHQGGPLPVLFKIDGFALTDQHGQSVHLESLAGKTWVADFIFTGCTAACPMLTSRMRTLQRHLQARETAAGHDLGVRLVSFSVDPEVDTPEKLLAYAKKWEADDRLWLFLTGPLAEMNHAVIGSMKIPFEKGGADTSAFDVMHGERFVLVDAQGRIRGYFDADPEGLERLESAMDALAKENASG